MSDETIPVDRERSALILVDIQPDFCPGGALPVEEGDAILPGIRKLMESDLFGLQAATQDWHPAGHVSFASNHDGHEPMDVIELHGHDQTLWPDHCVQGTPGAELHPDLPWESVAVIVRKGTQRDADSYSGFRNNWNAEGERPSTGLAGYLKERGVETLYLCGLARDVCVKWTAEDGAAEGFDVYYLWDLTRGVDPSADEEVRADLEDAGVAIIEADRLTG
ncbi:MAG: bifunctional nicotinamidase/pyrazinamidase [Gemmatimonadetes bacterium]|nr:bifunctional nicotinamidase/pyrazinamidase [Gemmatimonadota bacterium]NIV82036.1 bifunctional nicotinamidase/pyrazinamidase [Gemmatimonadota bacterium]NIY38738.1 bifunctional nicotinamidase/pyrazinamidase [Gemmatimonadota bacterium]